MERFKADAHISKARIEGGRPLEGLERSLFFSAERLGEANLIMKADRLSLEAMRGLERCFECGDRLVVALGVEMTEADHRARATGLERRARGELKLADGVVVKSHLTIGNAEIKMRRAIVF